MKDLLNLQTLGKLVLGGGAGWLGSELITSLLSATNIITPELLQNNGLLQTIFSASQNLLGGSVSLQPIVQGIISVLSALGPAGTDIMKLVTNLIGKK